MAKMAADVRKDINDGHFLTALHKLNESLANSCNQPNDNYLLLLMRSYCYQQNHVQNRFKTTESLDLALKDAQEAVKLFPDKSYCYLQAGLVLMDLKKYKDAECMLLEAIKNSDGCLKKQLDRELLLIRFMWLLSMDPPPDDSVAFLAAYKTETIAQAEDVLKAGGCRNLSILDFIKGQAADQTGESSARQNQDSSKDKGKKSEKPKELKRMKPRQVDDWARLDDEESGYAEDDQEVGIKNKKDNLKLQSDLSGASTPTDSSSASFAVRNRHLEDFDELHICTTKPKTVEKPTNIFKLHGLWVGSLAEKIDRHELKSLFSKFGFVVDVNRPYKTKYAFVIFDNYDSPVRAITQLRDKPMEDFAIKDKKYLRLKFVPSGKQIAYDRMPMEEYKRKCQAAGECPEWRLERKCKDCNGKHEPANWGIDSPPKICQ